MSFFRPKVKPVETVAAPSTVASPTDLLGSMARRRRLSGGRNSFAPSGQSSAAASGQTKPATLTGVNP